ncbi:MAG TPA: hypothetical protein VGP46_00360 [Acidimicrobiales bacterium]|jgi:hypothetical protein|nr:hypothetical protein [Acidimicrobiales bacterium]
MTSFVIRLAPGGVDGLKFVGRDGTATTAVPPFSKTVEAGKLVDVVDELVVETVG